MNQSKEIVSNQVENVETEVRPSWQRPEVTLYGIEKLTASQNAGTVDGGVTGS